MSDHDDEVLRRYRAMERPAPPAALDAAILAASRRSVQRRPFARWAAPISIAAVLVLALGLVLKVQREAPDEAMPSAARDAAPAANAPAATAAAPAAPISAPAQSESISGEKRGAFAEPPKVAAPSRETPAKKAAARPVQRAAPSRSEMAPAPRAPEPLVAKPSAEASRDSLETTLRERTAPSPNETREQEPSATRSRADLADAAGAEAKRVAPSTNTIAIAAAPPPAPAAAAPAAPARSLAKAQVADPIQRELERIAKLREEGRQDEADTALEAFRREHPDYRIPREMWERVRRP
jgi:hypothetical protein